MVPSKSFLTIIEFTREGIKITKPFRSHSMWFLIMHILCKFQLIIRIFSVVKLENKTGKMIQVPG